MNRQDVEPHSRPDRDVNVLRTVHPPRDLFERTYSALQDLEGGATDLDVEDLRRRLEAFRSSIARLRDEFAPERWELLAPALAGAIDALEVGSPDRARRALYRGLRRYIIGSQR